MQPQQFEEQRVHSPPRSGQDKENAECGGGVTQRKAREAGLALPPPRHRLSGVIAISMYFYLEDMAPHKPISPGPQETHMGPSSPG